MMASLTVEAIRVRLAALAPAIDDAERALDRADASGAYHQIARCRCELEQLDRERVELETALLDANPS